MIFPLSYLFNCGEGSQRIAHENKFKLAKVENIFFTRTSWANVGGLPGIALTIQDVGLPLINLHGAPGLDDLFQATSRFIILDHLKVLHVDATEPGAIYEDTVMKVDYVPVMPSTDSTSPDNSRHSPIEEDETANYYNKGSNLWPKKST